MGGSVCCTMATTVDGITQRKKAPAGAQELLPKGDNAQPGNKLELLGMALFEPVLGKKRSKMLIRTLSAISMGAVLAVALSMGHLAFAAFLLLLQVGLFSELVNVRYERAKEVQIPLFRTVQWAWFFTAVFSAYGSEFLRAPLGLSEYLDAADIPMFGTWSNLHEWVSFSLYSVLFMVTVLSLKRGCYLYQITQMAWTVFSLLITTVQMKSVVFNIAIGYFWVLFPVLLVITNDTMAYFCGQLAKKRIFGKDTVFLQLSPNKTWEGFIGGGIFTLLFGFFLPVYLSKFDYLTCSYEQSLVQSSTDVACAELPGSVFVAVENLWGLPITAAPIQLHGVALGAFASIVAPFGGFFASAVKRAYGLEDFSDLIPGHGGFMDRLDCQFIMLLCTNVHYNVFIAAPALPSFAAILGAVEVMTPELRQQLLEKLQGMSTA